MFVEHLTGKMLSFDFYLRVGFGFHGLPLLMFKPDGLVDLGGLDLWENDVIYSLT